MNIPLLIAIIAVPILVGITVIFFIFRNVNKKYCRHFVNVVETAKQRPQAIRNIILKGNERDKDIIVRELISIDNVERAEIIRFGKTVTQLQLSAVSADKKAQFHVELSKYHDQELNRETWAISDFYRMTNEKGGGKRGQETS